MAAIGGGGRSPTVIHEPTRRKERHWSGQPVASKERSQKAMVENWLSLSHTPMGGPRHEREWSVRRRRHLRWWWWWWCRMFLLR
ncbi:hypothetical protein L1049_028078 [Liquidambar formosana]|uniref:Uncharacterized protein n=1 Tax=Liquidambar formosana TaxID=63359 RepID=A0AAP0RI78_LIQFO